MTHWILIGFLYLSPSDSADRMVLAPMGEYTTKEKCEEAMDSIKWLLKPTESKENIQRFVCVEK